MVEFAGGSGAKDILSTVQPGALTATVSPVELGAGDDGDVGSACAIVAVGVEAADSIDGAGWQATTNAARDSIIRDMGNLRIYTSISPFTCETLHFKPKFTSFSFYQDFLKLEYTVGTVA
jgi:hypothetical protein